MSSACRPLDEAIPAGDHRNTNFCGRQLRISAVNAAENLAFQVQLQNSVVIAVGHIQRLVRREIRSPGGADIGPLLQEFSSGVEDLAAIVLPIRHVYAALIIDSYGMRRVELP